ncbi:MAG: enolase C-terminal domain-like protein [Bryobacteraceae bacterium]
MQAKRARLAALAAAQSPAATGSGDEGLEIAGLSVYPLREPVSRRGYTVVKLATKGGLTGFGECASVKPHELAAARNVVIGRPASNYEGLRHGLRTLPGLEAAVGMAALDVLGKLSKAPVYQVLGGPTRNKARALCRLHGESDKELVSSLAKAREAGFRAFAVPAPAPTARNHGRAFVDAVRRRMDALRAAGGENSDFVLDASGALTPGDAAVAAAALERFHLLWFDEPCRVANLAAVRKISEECVTPVGFGRNIDDASLFQDLLREQAIDVLRPDIGRASIGRIRRLAALAETYYVAVAPYHDGGPVASAAALHLAASLPNFFIQQIPFPAAEEDRRMRAELTGQPVENIREGYADLVTGPGLGIAVNEAALERYRERGA